MRRLLAVLALLLGGLATEAARPLQCDLVPSTQARRREAPGRRSGP
ncbi:hypothetical protein [Achromobacter aloeverae]|nr:hypothetical protein [Achromobacter aloeverae]